MLIIGVIFVCVLLFGFVEIVLVVLCKCVFVGVVVGCFDM